MCRNTHKVIQCLQLHILHQMRQYSSVNALHEKPYFPSPRISWKTQKDKINIIFPSTFWLTYFSSSKSSKEERFSNQYISSFYQLFSSKKDHIFHLWKVQNKNFSVISKYNLSINFLAQKKDRISQLWKVQNKNFSLINRYHISINFLARKKTVFTFSITYRFLITGRSSSLFLIHHTGFVNTKERSSFYQFPA